MLFLTHFTHLPYPWARFSSSQTNLIPQVPYMHVLFLTHFTWLPYPRASLSFSHTNSTLGSSSHAHYIVVIHSMHITSYSWATFFLAHQLSNLYSSHAHHVVSHWLLHKPAVSLKNWGEFVSRRRSWHWVIWRWDLGKRVLAKSLTPKHLRNVYQWESAHGS